MMRNRKLPLKKRRCLSSTAVVNIVPQICAVPVREKSDCIDLRRLYNTEMLPMMLSVETPSIWHRRDVLNEFEFGCDIGESQQSTPTRIAPNILCGFLRRTAAKQPLVRSLLYQLGSPSVQRLEETLNSWLVDDLFFGPELCIVHENSVAFRVQQYQQSFVVSRRCCQCIDTHGVKAYIEWKCKRKCGIGVAGEQIQLARECKEAGNVHIDVYEPQSIIRRAIDIGVLPIAADEPYIHTALVVTPRLIITWSQQKCHT